MPLFFYTISFTAVAFSVLSGAVLVVLIKSPGEGQMVDLSPWGMWTEWREGQKCCPTVTKVFGVRGQESICSVLRGHCFAGRDLLLCVCCSVFQHVGGWIFTQNELTFEQRRSITFWRGMKHTHTHTLQHNICFIGTSENIVRKRSQ